MSERIEVFELIERLDAASRDETLSDGMLYRAAAERLAEYISRDVKYWHKIMQRTDKQADRIRELEDRLQLQVIRYADLETRLQRIGELPEKWRDISRKTTEDYTNLHGCADELQAGLE